MSKTSRKKDPLEQKKAFRDARLIVIATEDRYAAPQYFESPLFEDYQRVKIEILPTEDDGRGSPQHVMDRAKSFIKNASPKMAGTQEMNVGS